MTELAASPFFRCGTVAVAGRPNVGKSSLLNRLLDFKVSIVSEKPQTTRNIIPCVYNGPDFQAVFLDTPGIHIARHKLGRPLWSPPSGIERCGRDLLCRRDRGQDLSRRMRPYGLSPPRSFR